MPQRTVADLVIGFSEIGNLSKTAKSLAEHATDFEPPIYRSRLKKRAPEKPPERPSIWDRNVMSLPKYPYFTPFSLFTLYSESEIIL